MGCPNNGRHEKRQRTRRVETLGSLGTWPVMTTCLSCTVMAIRSYWGHDLDFLVSRDVISHMTIGFMYFDYSSSEPNRKWIWCSVAETHPYEDAKLRTP